ncbi:MAG: hypothetical protein AMXMBFR13_46150 [Phycisphaerae bacterium]
MKTGAARDGGATVACQRRATGLTELRRLPIPRQVFLVFVNDEQIAYNWRWERSDPEEPTLPVDHQSRFKKRLL